MAQPECQREDPEFDAWCDRVVAALEAGASVIGTNCSTGPDHMLNVIREIKAVDIRYTRADESHIFAMLEEVPERDLTGPVLLGCLGLLILGAAWGCGLGICHRKEKKK